LGVRHCFESCDTTSQWCTPCRYTAAQHVLHRAVSYCQQFTVHAGKRDFTQAVKKVRPALVTSTLQRYVQIAWTAGHPVGMANVATGIGYTRINLPVQNIAVSAPVLLNLSITKLVSSDIVCAKPRTDWSKSRKDGQNIIESSKSSATFTPTDFHETHKFQAAVCRGFHFRILTKLVSTCEKMRE